MDEYDSVSTPADANPTLGKPIPWRHGPASASSSVEMTPSQRAEVGAMGENAFNVIGLDPLTAGAATVYDMAHRPNAINDLFDPNKHTWKEDYNTYRATTAARRADVNAASPNSAQAGNLIGNVYVGARALPAATEAAAAKVGTIFNSPLPAAATRYWGGAPVRAAEQFGQSAINEYRDNPNSTLSDVATAGAEGAGITGALHGLGAIVSKGAGWLGDKIRQVGIAKTRDSVEALLRAAEDPNHAEHATAKQALVDAFGEPGETAEAYHQEAGDGTTIADDARNFLEHSNQLLKGESGETMTEGAQNLAGVKGPKGNVVDVTQRATGPTIMNTLGSVGSKLVSHPLGPLGAVAGYMSDPGDFIDKTESAGKGAVVGYLAGKAAEIPGQVMGLTTPEGLAVLARKTIQRTPPAYNAYAIDSQSQPKYEDVSTDVNSSDPYDAVSTDAK